MNQNQLLNLNNRPQGTQVAPLQKDFENQIVDPEILGFDHKTNQAGNAYVNFKKASAPAPPKQSKGSSTEDRGRKGSGAKSKKAEETFRQRGVSGIQLSQFPSITYSFMTPPEATATMDSSVYVRPKNRSGPGQGFARPSGGFEADTEGMFDYGESSELWELQADASTNTKPIGYRDLDLLPTFESVDKETQVGPAELEKTAATLRGIIVNPDNILWMTNGDFSILKAEKQIEEYISRCWKVCSRWYYHIQFLHAVEGCYRNRYFFEVKWSLPTKENPIPVATASVYFAFDVDIYSGRDEPVKVNYVLEGTRYPHVPGQIPFQQKWISGIICEKMRLIRSVKF